MDSASLKTRLWHKRQSFLNAYRHLLEYFREDNTTMKTIIRTAIVAAFMFVVSVPFVAAQDEINKGEFFGGFMHKRVEGEGFNGFNVSGTYNFHHYLGIKGDFSWAKKDPVSATTYMAGVQMKDNRKNDSMVKPFAHVLIGAQRWAIDTGSMVALGIDAPQGISAPAAQTGFSMAFGGGIDIKVSDRVSIRAIQYDYNPVWIDGNRGDTNRFSFGFVIN